MPTPGEHKTVQARILKYAEVIGWTVVSREESEQRRGFDPEAAYPAHLALSLNKIIVLILFMIY